MPPNGGQGGEDRDMHMPASSDGRTTPTERITRGPSAKPKGRGGGSAGGARKRKRPSVYPADLPFLRKSAAAAESMDAFLFDLVTNRSEDAALLALAHPEDFPLGDINAPKGSAEGFPGLTLLHTAALSARVGVMERLIQLGADTMVENPDARLAIHLALSADDVADEARMFEGIRVLAAAAPIVPQAQAPDNFGWTAFHYAADYNYLQVADWLMCRGVCTTYPDKEGCTPLIMAAFKGLPDMVKLLLGPVGGGVSEGGEGGAEDPASRRVRSQAQADALASLNKKNIYGNTALHYAAYRADFTPDEYRARGGKELHMDGRHADCMMALIAHKAEAVPNNAGATPLNLMGHNEECELRKKMVEYSRVEVEISSDEDIDIYNNSQDIDVHDNSQEEEEEDRDSGDDDDSFGGGG